MPNTRMAKMVWNGRGLAIAASARPPRRQSARRKAVQAAVNELITVKQAAKIFNVGESNIYYHVDKGHLVPVRPEPHEERSDFPFLFCRAEVLAAKRRYGSKRKDEA